MTVQNVPNFVDHVGNGVVTSFPFVFRADDVSWVAVSFLTDIIGVSLNADQDTTPGGTVDYSIAPPVAQDIKVLRITPQAQDLDYTRYDPFDSESHEDALDKLTMEVQDLDQVSASGIAFLQVQIDAIVLGATGRFQDLTDVDDLHDFMFVGPNVDFNAQAMQNFTIQHQVVGSVAGVSLLDYRLGQDVTLVLTEDITSFDFANVPVGQLAQFEIELQQDSTPRVITWPVTFRFPGGTPPDITAADSIAIIHMRSTNGGAGPWDVTFAENMA